MDRKQANIQMLAEADVIQDETLKIILRAQVTASETEELALATLVEMKKQGSQMVIISTHILRNDSSNWNSFIFQDDCNAELEIVSNKLDHSQALQNKFDAWTGNWFGGKKRSALKEASADIAARNQEHLGLPNVLICFSDDS